MAEVKIIECPRDGMQGLPTFIPTQSKADYINALLKVGFHTVDFGSFVSPKAIPQMQDTADVLNLLDMKRTDSYLLAIIGNIRGAMDACAHDEIKYLGYPHSTSATFLERNIRTTREDSFKTIEQIHNQCESCGKELVVYISMGFGNPYGDPWYPDLVAEDVVRLHETGIRTIPLSDTVGLSKPMDIAKLFKQLIPAFPDIDFGFHLHASPSSWEKQVSAAFENGCRRFDTVNTGLGGCPMAEDELVGNLRTVDLINWLKKKGVDPGIDTEAFEKAYLQALITFHDFLA